MNESTWLYEDSLQHHGIIGMKWGIRRFQKKDGSLTPEGAERYNEDHTNSSGNYSKAETSSEGHTGSSGSYSNSELSPEELEARSARRKDIAKKVAIGIGITAAVVGAAYVGHYMGMKAGETKAVDADLAKDLVSGLSKESAVPLLPPPSGKPQVGNMTVSTPKIETPKATVKEAEKPSIKPHDDHTKAHDRKDVSEYSTKELAEITARLGLEKKYKDLTTEKTTSGRKKAANILRAASGAISATTPVMAIAGRNDPQSAASKAANVIGSVGKAAGAAAAILDLLEKVNG